MNFSETKITSFVGSYLKLKFWDAQVPKFNMTWHDIAETRHNFYIIKEHNRETTKFKIPQFEFVPV